MKKNITTLLTTAAIVMITGSFAVAQSLATQTAGNFPYFLFGCLVIGGLSIISLKSKFEKMYFSETVGIFALYTIMISLFTDPVIDAIKMIVS